MYAVSKKIAFSMALLGLLLWPSAGYGEGSSIAEGSAIALFDGKSLEGWETEDRGPVTKGWKVEDGNLVWTERSQSIYAPGTFGDFELSFEWKIARGGNSGIKYRVAYYQKGVRGWPGWLGCEYQLFDDAGRETSPQQSAGALYDLYAPNEKKKLKPIDQYNQSKIVLVGSHIEHWLNGAKIVEVDTQSEDWKQKIARSKFHRAQGFLENPRGRIQFQDHGHKVWFRNVMLRELNSKDKTISR